MTSRQQTTTSDGAREGGAERRAAARWSSKQWCSALALLVVCVALLAVSRAASQGPLDGPPGQQGEAAGLCDHSKLTSFFCKAGQTVLGAAKLATSILTRPKHPGVPDNEPLELSNEDGPGRNQHEQQQPPPLPAYLGGPSRKRERIYCRTSAEAGEQRGVCRPLPACFHRHGGSIKYEWDANQCPAGLICCPKHASAAPHKARPQDGSGPVAHLHQSPRPSPNLAALQLDQHLGGGAAGKPAAFALDAIRSIITQVFQPPTVGGGGAQAATSGHSAETERVNEIERSIASEGLALKRHSPSDLHQRFIQLRNSKLVGQLARDGADFLAVATRLVSSSTVAPPGSSSSEAGACRPADEKREEADGTVVTSSRDECPPERQQQQQQPAQRRHQLGALPEIDFSQTELAQRCPGDPVCERGADRNPFRTSDGSCNNLRHTGWGRSNSPYTRILPPDYEDRVSEMRRTGVTGRELPNARSVSLAAIRWNERAESGRATLMLMQWGQFIDHDLTLAATTPMLTPQGTSIDCCNRRLLQDPRFKHPACISVLLPDQDPFYARFNVGCMNLVRNAPSPPVGCRLRAREQLNQLTHFLDGSMIYGNDEQQAAGLRLFRGGLLKSSRINGLEFLPFDGRIGEGCILPRAGIRRGMRCFVSGDNRVNEHSGLVTTQAMFLREHNRLARLLWSLNPEWDDERLYQEARRVVIAEIQHITYNEWLPLIVGPLVMRDFKLELSQSNGGYSLDYDAKTNPSIINEFAAAAYRLHSLVQGSFNFQTEDGQLIQQFKLRHIFNNPASLYRHGNYDGCINSMINEPCQAIDNQFTEELTNHLFQDTNSSFGMDLVTINIQRGRDHGLPGYNFFRQACGLTRLQSFQQLDQVMTEGAGEIFSRLYAHVDDIDLFIAGNYERKLKDAMVGPVFACIIGEQFRRLKVGDRYWYENGNQAGAFTPSQLSEVKRSSLARIICDNSDSIERTQPLAFLRPNPDWNPKMSCDQIPWVDLRHWQANRMESFDPFSFRGSREPTARRLDTADDAVASNTTFVNFEDDGLD